jgi:hypothetical protein
MNNCEFCDKKGLAVLPVRPAIAPAGSHAPKANAAMLAGADSIPVAPADYTLRHLRPGYLYTYDEARKWLHAYVVIEGGYLYKLDPGETAPAKLAFTCAPDKCGTVASCVTIPDVKRATKVWFGFSDVQWTPAVIERHKDAAYRAKHMVCLDVQAWLGSKHHKGAADISQVEKVVAEYALSDAQGKSLAFTAGGFKSKASTSQALKDRIPAISPAGGLVLSMPDPAGVAADLGALMQHLHESFVNAKGWKRELAASTAISQIEAAVRASALEAEDAAAEQLANEALSQPDIGMLFDSYRKKKLQQIEEIRDVSPAEAKRAEDNAWRKYADKFDQTAAKDWKKQFDDQMKQWDEKQISPLALAHVAWMKSSTLQHKMECTHDGVSADSGIAYAKTISLCIAGTQDKGACFDLYTEWLAADVIGKENLLLKALTLNLEKTQKDIQDALKVSLDPRSFPFDGLVGSFTEATKRVTELKADAVGKGLLLMVYGPMAKVMARAVDGRLRPSLVALGLYTGKTFAVLEVVGSKKAFRAQLIRELLRSSGKVVKPRDMERAVSAELRRLKSEGVQLDGTQKKRFLIMVDQERISAMPQGQSSAEQARWLASNITTQEKLESLNLSSWREQLRSPESSAILKLGPQARERMAAVIPFIGGLVAAVIQYNAVQKLAEDEGKAMSHEAKEAKWRYGAGVAALAGTITEMSGLAAEKVASTVPKLARGLTWIASKMQLVGKLIGVAGALVMAAWDIKLGVDQVKARNVGIGAAYFASAALGMGAAAALFFSWTGVGLLLVLAVMAVAVLIEYIKDNKVQSWLERCIWGNGPAPRYSNEQEEMAQLRVAFS